MTCEDMVSRHWSLGRGAVCVCHSSGRSDGGNPPETQSDHDEGVSDTSRVRVVDSNRLEDLEDDVEDVIRVTNEDVEVEEDVIPNTEDVEEEDVNVNMEDMEDTQDSDIEAVRRLLTERDKLSNQVVKINNKLTEITDKFV